MNCVTDHEWASVLLVYIFHFLVMNTGQVHNQKNGGLMSIWWQLLEGEAGWRRHSRRETRNCRAQIFSKNLAVRALVGKQSQNNEMMPKNVITMVTQLFSGGTQGRKWLTLWGGGVITSSHFPGFSLTPQRTPDLPSHQNCASSFFWLFIMGGRNFTFTCLRTKFATILITSWRSELFHTLLLLLNTFAIPLPSYIPKRIENRLSYCLGCYNQIS